MIGKRESDAETADHLAIEVGWAWVDERMDTWAMAKFFEQPESKMERALHRFLESRRAVNS